MVTGVGDAAVVDVAEVEVDVDVDVDVDVCALALAVAPGVEDAVALTRAPGATIVCVTLGGIPLTESAVTPMPTGRDAASGIVGKGGGVITCAIAAAEATTPMLARRSSFDTGVLLSSER